MSGYEEFCKYFDELESLGISYGLSDMYRKAEELGIEPPQEFKR